MRLSEPPTPLETQATLLLVDDEPNVTAALRRILRNPLILGVLAAIPFAYWQVRLPGWLTTSGEYLAQLTLPLALDIRAKKSSLDEPVRPKFLILKSLRRFSASVSFDS